MSLGEKLRQARLDAGLSQRTLCGQVITRNMLSQIENGSAQPSMGTLQYLAGQLGRPVSFFLEETAVVSPNQALMAQARALYDAGDFAAAVEKLQAFQSPDGVLDREKALLNVLSRLGWAEKLLRDGRENHAREILKETATEGVYCREALEKQKQLMLAGLGEASLPSLDEELLLGAQAALRSGDYARAGHLLDAAEHQDLPRWQLLRGKARLGVRDYRAAAAQLLRAEAAFPEETAPALEICFKELGDYRRAYEYACKQRSAKF